MTLTLFLQGGLGNQLFQWATATVLASTINLPLRINTSNYALNNDQRELEVSKFAAVPKEEVVKELATFNHVTAHQDVPQEWRFAEVLDLSGTSATVRWNDSGKESVVEQSELRTADDQIVSGRIDLGRCMFCGLCMESCGFTSFFMTNEYDGMSGFTRQDLWFDASRTRVLPSVHQEAVDAELAKRASKERTKRAKKAAKAAAETAKPAEAQKGDA